MSGHFLWNDTLLDVELGADPRRLPGFPLAPEQYDALNVQELASLALDAMDQDPALARTRPRVAAILAQMLSDKAGANAMRIRHGDTGPTLEWASVPAPALAALASLEKQGQLSNEMLEQAVWSKLQR